MKIFIICPVRSASTKQQIEIHNYISALKGRGDNVYYPAADTNQIDSVGYRICSDNKKAIAESDEVHIYWDKDSQGSLFDLGMAFAVNKPLKIINVVEPTTGKSFANMIKMWSEE